MSPEFFSSSFHWGRCHYFSSLRRPQGCLDVLMSWPSISSETYVPCTWACNWYPVFITPSPHYNPSLFPPIMDLRGNVDLCLRKPLPQQNGRQEIDQCVVWANLSMWATLRRATSRVISPFYKVVEGWLQWEIGKPAFADLTCSIRFRHDKSDN